MITIRLKPMGTKNRRKWRIVVSESHVSGSGRPIEELGSYNSLVNPPAVTIRKDRYEAWVQKGAKPSKTVKALLSHAH